MYRLVEVDGSLASEVLRSLNALDQSWPALTDDHLETGWFWLLKDDHGTLCGFCGMTPMEPFAGVGYLKRAYVSPDHRGHGLQLKMIEARLNKARELGWHQVVAETKSHWSAHNLALAGFEMIEVEQPWGEAGSLYFSKML
jgi:N-acetylglutamate synthase-like GNAT family acetyltransferase